MKPSLTLLVAMLVAGGALASDVFKTTDSKGQPVYTDRPATLPAERLDVRTQTTDEVEVQQRYDEQMKTYAAADKGADRPGRGRCRRGAGQRALRHRQGKALRGSPAALRVVHERAATVRAGRVRRGTSLPDGCRDRRSARKSPAGDEHLLQRGLIVPPAVGVRRPRRHGPGHGAQPAQGRPADRPLEPHR